ncbi:MAG: RNA methyltransferase [Desulfuromonas sp.]|nr:RNA methyltransferase [Desulfuromonas sp.]
MPPSCVNGGGQGSLLQLQTIPVCEQEIDLGRENLPALELWNARPGEILTAIDPERGCYRVRLTDLAEDPRGVPFVRLPRPVESRLAIDVYQALPEKERFELILQKLTELGAFRIVPVETARSITLVERDAEQAKSHRWPDIVLRAAKQCRRAMLPELFAAAGFSAALQLATDAELKLMLYEGEETWSFAEALGRLRPERVALLVGPEGGFADTEVNEARAAGFLPVSLGPRILRTETAAIAGVTLLQGLLGDLC